jgi:biotin carboxyl carrier protein
MTVPSTLSGTVQEVLVSVEDFVQEGQDLIKLG